MQAAFKTGMIFTAIGQYSNVVIQLLINVVLSRLIPVEEFGVVATVQVFLVFFQMLATAGIGPAIIQNKKLTKLDYGILFNFMTLFAIILSILFGLLGIVVAKVYHNQSYIQLFWLMAIIVLAEGMNVVPTAILNKSLRFKSLNIRLLVCNLLGAIAGIIAALNHFGVYALIISVALPAAGSLVANFFIVKIDYTLQLKLEPLKEVWSFAKNQLGFTILNYFSRNSDNLLIGKFLGPVPLANYQKSYQLITLPNTVFLGVISPVLQPVLSNHQDDVKLIRETFFKIVHVLALIAFPLTVFMVFNAKAIIVFLFGTNWLNAVTPFMILSISIWAQMLTSATGSIFMARNHSKTLFHTGIISTILILSFTIIGLLLGTIETVAVLVCLAYMLNFFTSYGFLLYKVLESKFSDLFKELIKPFGLSIILLLEMVLAVHFIDFSNSFLTLLIRGMIWGVSLVLLCLISGEWKKIIQLLQSK